ncbi:class I SAM-dependent methyltransferase [Glycomyces sp. NPDC047010]|uniref:class I SAM-dependent methyltransferase n=1 Tax=Glycomyces sp. NPDC047010 TaxID=3155023 RepID=UPI0033C723DD
MVVDVERTMENYRDAGNLKTRVGLFRFRRDDFDPVEFAAGLLPRDLGLILDVGAGYGRYTRRLRADRPEATVVAVDKAPGMLAEVPEPAMTADAQAIPYPDGGVDGLLALHMLYHVPDVAAAVAEFRRVLQTGGTLLVATNAADDMDALYVLWRKAIATLPEADRYDPRGPLPHFDSANAPALLKARFDTVEVFADTGPVSVPEPEPLIAYLRSARSLMDCTDAVYEASMLAAERLLAEHFASHTTFDFTKRLVFYRCR